MSAEPPWLVALRERRRAATSKPAQCERGRDAGAMLLTEPADLDDLVYGPGIVSKLKSRYIKLTLRDAAGDAKPLRRAASLEHGLDDAADDEPPKRVQRPQRYRPTQRAPDCAKRARSVDALARADSRSPPPRAEPAPPPPPPPLPPPTERLARPKRPAPLLKETERPPPDVVKTTMRLFEGRRARPTANGGRVADRARAFAARGAKPPVPPRSPLPPPPNKWTSTPEPAEPHPKRPDAPPLSPVANGTATASASSSSSSSSSSSEDELDERPLANDAELFRRAKLLAPLTPLAIGPCAEPSPPPSPPPSPLRLTPREIEMNLINSAKSLESPTTNGEPTKPPPKRPQQPPPPATTMVFNFSDRKEVPDYIENDGVVLRSSRRDRPKVAEGSEDDPDGGEWALWAAGPPSPCDVVFENDNVLINGRSNIAKPNSKPKKLKIQFDDSLTRTFEYPSEDSLIEEPTPMQAINPVSPLAVGSSLSTYTPSKVLLQTESFELGVTKTVPPPITNGQKMEIDDVPLTKNGDTESHEWSHETHNGAGDLLY